MKVWQRWEGWRMGLATSDEEEAAPQATGIKTRATVTQAFSELKTNNLRKSLQLAVRCKQNKNKSRG